MKALTLWRPWTDAILYGGKRVENRPWHPPQSIIGELIALHAGKTYDIEGAEWMRDKGIYTPPDPEQSPLGIVGVARIVRYAKEGLLFSDSITGDPWFFGPYGWLLSGVTALEHPIPAGGAQGLWQVPERVLAEMRSTWPNRRAS